MEKRSSSQIDTRFHLQKCPKCSSIVVLFLLFHLTVSADTSYPTHCNNFVLEQRVIENPDAQIVTSTNSVFLRNAHLDVVSNGKGISVSPYKSLTLSSHKTYPTQNDGVIKIDAMLSLTGGDYVRNFTIRRGLRLVNIRSPRIPVNGATRSVTFSLSGFWDLVTGKLCMVGSGFGSLRSSSVVLKLDYLNSSSIFSSLVNGTLESLDAGVDSTFNKKSMLILGVNLKNYRYELIDKEIDRNGFRSLDDVSSVSLGLEDLRQSMCTYLISAGTAELKYESDCDRVNCEFLGGRDGKFMPSTMHFNEIECLEDGRVRFLLGFGDIGHNGYRLPFEPNVTLVSEGKWDAKNNRLNLVGCRIFSDWDEGFIGECLVRLSLRFPSRWTLKERSFVVGELWSSRSVNESGYFGRVRLESLKNMHMRSGSLGYEYTYIEKAKRYCVDKPKPKAEGGTYPNSLSPDMRFDFVVGNRKMKNLWGYLSPVYVDNRAYLLYTALGQEAESLLTGNRNFSKAINISCVLDVASSRYFKLNNEFSNIKSFEISAEGTYDYTTGHLCLTGCLLVGSPEIRKGRNTSMDCEVFVDIQYPHLNTKKGRVIKGRIESTRPKPDPLYFEPFDIVSSSIYTGQARESIWRMDLEIAMVLISNSLSCVFIVLQLLHVKRNQDVLPSVSVIMLAFLTLAHMIPLLLNFEALFITRSSNSVNVYFGSDGWLEVNEVLVRVITMIAFLLEFRLLQLAWSSRSSNVEDQRNLWTSDKKVLFLCLPMYICGGLIAQFVHLSRMSYSRPRSRISRVRNEQLSFWGDLKSYVGVILDGFLLPQILFNIFSDSKEKALSPWFYVGTTFVRLLPHIYDLYRSHSSSWSFNYIYANPRTDYYSTSWDIVASVWGFVFVWLVYLQQRYGGRSLLPSRLRRRSVYEKVPAGSELTYL